ncbi:hypothetical protein RE476_08695 [Methanolobus mangrovi]|uniref:Uncharacterized protein n=1 Tax=Methanolobus mangrovi TaxID=3072977 RepID=A0AA51UE09_9EURY|nr:hypothetical protein [Methanolobus mangrovi]WMW21477.1 hypothetical protein RE476_08695 [Methanolobus mangrovi]
MSSTDLVKYGNRPELMFRVSLSPDGSTYQKEVSLVFPKYASADLPHYKEGYMSGIQNRDSDDCQWHFSAED